MCIYGLVVVVVVAAATEQQTAEVHTTVNWCSIRMFFFSFFGSLFFPESVQIVWNNHKFCDVFLLTFSRINIYAPPPLLSGSTLLFSLTLLLLKTKRLLLCILIAFTLVHARQRHKSSLEKCQTYSNNTSHNNYTLRFFFSFFRFWHKLQFSRRDKSTSPFFFIIKYYSSVNDACDECVTCSLSDMNKCDAEKMSLITMIMIIVRCALVSCRSLRRM